MTAPQAQASAIRFYRALLAARKREERQAQMAAINRRKAERRAAKQAR